VNLPFNHPLWDEIFIYSITFCRVPASSRTESIKEDVDEEGAGVDGAMDGGHFGEDEIECDDDVYLEDSAPSFIHHAAYRPGDQPLHSSPIIRQHGDNSQVHDLDLDVKAGVTEFGADRSSGRSGHQTRGNQEVNYRYVELALTNLRQIHIKWKHT